MDRTELGESIAARLAASARTARASYRGSESGIGHFVIDDLLPPTVASEIAAAFPAKETMVAKRSLRERKAVQARMAECRPLIGEAIYAFQQPEVVDTVARITGGPTVEPDPMLYAGGISTMTRGDFLRPHLDNSHDKDRARWRAFNLLYYVSEVEGGELELWPEGVGGDRIVIAPRFNRLVVMATHGESWHSVARVRGGARLCVSNYYFTPEPMRQTDRFHVTSFRGRPGAVLADAVLRLDTATRKIARFMLPGVQSAHINVGYERAGGF